jgi:alcohol dehydrogenase YqhD (iron-dependent ADH family)
MFPKESFLDPAFTVSVPKNYTGYGIVDLIAHCLEQYFGRGEPDVIDHFTFSIIRDALKNGTLLLNDLNNLELRSRILLDSTLALNGTLRYGKGNGDWGVHAIGHELSLLYDLPHGATLSIAYIAWLKLHSDRCPDRIVKLGENLFGVSDVEETIAMLSAGFRKLGSPVTLLEAGIGTDQKAAILKQMQANEVSGANHHLKPEDYEKLVEYMFGNT